MPARSLVALALLTATLLLAGTSGAAETEYEWRRVVTTAGEVYDGVLLERERDFILLGLEDGRVIEFLAAQLLRMEVIPAKPEDRPPPPVVEYEPDEGARIPSHLQGLSRSELTHRYAMADEAHVAAVAPTIPMLTIGMTIMFGSLPFLYDGSPAYPAYFAGSGLLIGSFGAAAGGAMRALDAEGWSEANDPMKFGFVFGLSGAAMMIIGLPLFQVTYGSGPDFFITGSGMGMAIAGASVVMAEAKYARDRLKRARRRVIRRRASALPGPRLRLVGFGAAPTREGGSVSLSFVF